jgi:PAS domain-containing protein
MPAIAWSADAQTFRFNYVNPAAETLLGYPVERWLDEPGFWMEHLHPEDRHVALICHNETLAARKDREARSPRRIAPRAVRPFI